MNLRATEWVFWISAASVLYTYAVFPVLMFLFAALKQAWRDVRFLLRRESRRRAARGQYEPHVALLVAAYNEEAIIAEKLRNTADLDYPAEKIDLLLGLDAPEDGTAEVARAQAGPNQQVIQFPVRRGKLAVINDLAARSNAEILVFSDANTILAPDAIRCLVRHFAEEGTGAVCGELRVVSPSGRVEMESLYWRYEVALKFLENRLNCVLGANGGVYAVRRDLFRPLDNWIVEDFQLPMEIRFAGYRVVYDPEAIGTEEAAPSLAAEYRRKVRIGAGACQTLLRNPGFLNPFAGMPAYAYFSHKVLRWLGPLFMLSALAASVLLAAEPFYAAALALQLAFYAVAWLGYVRLRRGKTGGLAATVFYFCSMNLALLHGMIRFLTGRQQALWNTTPRRASVTPVAAKGGTHE